MATRKVIRGDSDSFQITFTAKNNCNVATPIDISGWDIKFTVRKSIPATSVKSDTDAIIHKTATILDGPKGIAYFEISASDTNKDPGEYWYDIQYTRTLPTGELKIKSIPMGRYIIVADITRQEQYI